MDYQNWWSDSRFSEFKGEIINDSFKSKSDIEQKWLNTRGSQTTTFEIIYQYDKDRPHRQETHIHSFSALFIDEKLCNKIDSIEKVKDLI